MTPINLHAKNDNIFYPLLTQSVRKINVTSHVFFYLDHIEVYRYYNISGNDRYTTYTYYSRMTRILISKYMI